MQGEKHPARRAVSAARDQVLEQLSDAFAKDELGLDEFEARVDDAYRASTEEGLALLVKDLAPPAFAAPTSSGATTALAVPGERVRRVTALLGNVERRGRFRLSDGYRVLSIMGNVELDLRDALLPDGVTTIFVRAVLGNIEITVPPTLPVECEGSGILASFAELSRMPAEGSGTGPSLRIVGSAVLGNVEIRTLPRGVSPLQDRSAPRALPPKGEGKP